MSEPLAKRVYGGLTAAERAEERKQKLLAAALELIGSQGYHATKINDICQAAGVSQRYFYEAFSDSESMLIALYYREIGALMTAILPAMVFIEDRPLDSMRQGLTTFFQLLAERPHSARVAFFELYGVSKEVEQVYLDARERFQDVLIGYLRPLITSRAATDLDYQILSVGLTGALLELTRAWVKSDFDVSAEMLVETIIKWLPPLTTSRS